MEGRIDRGTSGTVDFSGHLRPAVDLTGGVHQLPCCIKYNGPSEVSHYFRPKHTDVVLDGLSVEEAHFRGRKLQGATLPIPQGYSGFVLGKRKPDGKANTSEENSNCWEMKAKFQNITYWNHDTPPSQNDDLSRAFHLFAVAKSLHRPVSIEDLESAQID
nr:ribonuclease H2 subunit C [Ipomoea batatas]